MAGFATAFDYTILLLAKKVWNPLAFLLVQVKQLGEPCLWVTETAWNSSAFLRYLQKSWMVHLRE